MSINRKATLSMWVFVIAILIALIAPASIAVGQENPLSEHNKFTYGFVKEILVRTAEKMPEEKYGFRPAESVRTFGQIIGHVADAQYHFCSAVLGQKPAALNNEKKTSKAELIAALKDAFAYCDKAYDGMTDASGAQTLKFFGRDTPRHGVLSVNQTHTIEHYGNLVTYLRMNDIVPPTSEPGFGQPAKK